MQLNIHLENIVLNNAVNSLRSGTIIIFTGSEFALTFLNVTTIHVKSVEKNFHIHIEESSQGPARWNAIILFQDLFTEN